MTSLSTYDFHTLYTTLPRNLIKDKRIALIDEPQQEKDLIYFACTGCPKRYETFLNLNKSTTLKFGIRKI